MGRFYIVRHGNTFEAGEPARRIGARTDIALTATGRQQGEALGLWFRDRSIAFDCVLCGPLMRSRQTANLILAAQAASPPIRVAGWLNEIDHGPDEGLTEAEVIKRIGREALDHWDGDGLAPPGWSVDGADRTAAWRALFEDNSRCDVLLVTSNGAARFALIAIGALMSQSLKLRTGAMGIIQRDATGVLKVQAWDIMPEPPGR